MSLNGDGVCPKEKTAQPNSPHGKISNNETLARIVHAQFVQDNRIKTGALKINDLGKDGWSLIRKCYADMPHALKRHAEGKSQKFSEYGYATINTGKIRGILDDDQNQAVCVIDNALENFPEHALAQESIARKSSKRREIRDELLALFEQPQFIAD